MLKFVASLTTARLPMKSDRLSRERLLEYLDYNKDTGVFRWKVSVGRHGRIPAGTIAGSKGKHGGGYIEIHFDGKMHKAHRLAWLYVVGEYPKNEIDHINQKRADNRFVNLREATLQENLKNKTKYKSNTSGFIGVTWHRLVKKWQARIGVDTKRIHLGYFDAPEKAYEVYKEAKAKYHPEGCL